MPKTLTPDEIKASKQKLLRSHELMQKAYDFKPKQFVRWKEGLQNKKIPAYGEPAIVWEVLSEPLVEPSEEAGSAYFREPLNIVLGLMSAEDEFILFHFDKRRFEPFPD
jgi:hypothetical protein